jgi:hypothetical protein
MKNVHPVELLQSKIARLGTARWNKILKNINPEESGLFHQNKPAKITNQQLNNKDQITTLNT